MALVRVYCGLASAQQSEAPVPTGTPLTAAVVDDAGRLLDLCEIGDDPSGYARLAAVLAERSNGSTGVAIAADSGEHLITALFNAAGRPLAFADEEAVDDYAERFADDDSTEEIESPQVQRRAVGLARALQAGALSALAQPTPRDLAGYKPVLAAHGALINGRQAAAVALREVLRELYPAALRAYPDPAEPVSLAVLDALPEPGLLNGSGGGRAREAAATEAVAARLANEGVADSSTLTDAITALRVAASETPRRNGVTKSLTAAIGETVRQAVAAVRACDAACDTLVGTLAGRVSASSVAASAGRRTSRRPASAELPVSAPAEVEIERPARGPVAPPRRGSRQQPVAAQGAPLSPQPMAPPPVTPPPIIPRPVSPAAGLPTAPRSSPPGVRVPTPPPLRRPNANPPGINPISVPPPVSPASSPPVPAVARYDEQSIRPVSSPPPPPGITPIVPSQRANVPPAEAGEPFRATLTAAAINSVRAERQQRAAEARRQTESGGVEGPPPPGISAADVSIPVPATRPNRPETPAPGSRANWPLRNGSDDRAATAVGPLGGAQSPLGFAKYGDNGPGERAPEKAKEAGRVTPPWQADDLPPEPPMLRLVEPPATDLPARSGLGLDGPATDPLGTGPLGRGEPSRLDPPPLRLVEPEAPRNGSRRGPEDLPAAPVSASSEDDGDLLIFAATRSAWFTGQNEAPADLEWTSSADDGWRAAEQAARPSVGAETNAGLPKRVPQANLVPGSPLREERPLRIVRDPASIAAHTTGYFRGWRRGQEIGGYAVGGRPGREAAGGWDFSRDSTGTEAGEDYEYRPASYRSS